MSVVIIGQLSIVYNYWTLKTRDDEKNDIISEKLHLHVLGE